MRFIILMLFIILTSFVQLSPALCEELSDPSIYPLVSCTVCDKMLDTQSDVVTTKIDGRELRFCGSVCESIFEKDPASHFEKIDQAIIEDQLPFYPLATCLVTEQALGNMGEPANYLYQNRLIRFCCLGCLNSFNKQPDKYITKLDKAVIAAQSEKYPTDTCPVTGEKLGGMGEPYDYIFAGRLVRFCCAGCIGGFKSNPVAAMASVYGDDSKERKGE